MWERFHRRSSCPDCRSCASFLLFSSFLARTQAQVIALDLTGGASDVPTNDGSAPYSLGWSFTTTQPFTAYGLGFWDDASHTLGFTHDIGLWDSSQNVLASTVISLSSRPVTSAGPGQWLFNSISPVTLPAGTYYLGANYDPSDSVDAYRYHAVTATTAGVTFDTDAYALHTAGGLTFPSGSNGSTADFADYFGPNVAFSPLPEPSSLALLFAFAVSSFAARRRIGTRSPDKDQLPK